MVSLYLLPPIYTATPPCTYLPPVVCDWFPRILLLATSLTAEALPKHLSSYSVKSGNYKTGVNQQNYLDSITSVIPHLDTLPIHLSYLYHTRLVSCL